MNSLYPSVAFNDFFGTNCILESFTDMYRKNILSDDLFCFYYCEVVAPSDAYLGLLPVKDKGGDNVPHWVMMWLVL